MKIIIISTLFVALSSYCFSQNYVQIKEDFEINGNKIFKGEIFALLTNNKILFGKDEFAIDRNKFEVIGLDPKDFPLSNIIYIKNINEKYYQIDISKYFNNSDSILLIKNDNNLLPLNLNTSNNVSISDCGYIFRIIIPNKPSIVYYSGDIPKAQIIDNDPVKSELPNKSPSFFGNFSWWKYVLISILTFAIFILFKFLFSRISKLSKKEAKYEIYAGGKLSDFAHKHDIEIDDLVKLNKSILKGYLKLNDEEKRKFQERIKNGKLIVGYSPKIYNVQPKSSLPTESNLEINPELLHHLVTMENKIINKIETLVSNKEASQKIEIQQKDIELLNNKLLQNSKEKENLLGDYNSIQNELQQAKNEKFQLETQVERYTEKVLFVDFLEPVAVIASEYFTIGMQGYQKALEFYNKISISENEHSLIIAQLLLKFQSNIPTKVGNWEQIINEIKKNKTTSNSELIISFKQIQNDAEKSNEFKRILFKEVFGVFSSNLLILAEELSNLSKFTGSTSALIREVELYFQNFSKELQNKTKTLGFGLNYVPLFENYENYAAYTKLANQICSFPYRNIQHLEKDTVLEIISYGFDNDETKVILA